MSETHDFVGNEAGYWCFYEYPNGKQCGLDRDHAFHKVSPPKPVAPELEWNGHGNPNNADNWVEVSPPKPQEEATCKHEWVGDGYDEVLHCDLCGVFADCEGCRKPGCPCNAVEAPQEIEKVRCKHGVWAADHCYKCEAEPTPAPQTEMSFDEWWDGYVCAGSMDFMTGHTEEIARAAWNAAKEQK